MNSSEASTNNESGKMQDDVSWSLHMNPTNLDMRVRFTGGSVEIAVETPYANMPNIPLISGLTKDFILKLKANLTPNQDEKSKNLYSSAQTLNYDFSLGPITGVPRGTSGGTLHGAPKGI